MVWECHVRTIDFSRTIRYNVIMQFTASSLRQNIYKVLDKSLKTGQIIEIVRHGKILKIVPPEKIDRLKNLPKRDVMNCDPEELVHIDWSSEWKI